MRCSWFSGGVIIVTDAVAVHTVHDFKISLLQGALPHKDQPPFP